MARQVRDAVLDTRNVRRSLKQRPEPYWRALDRGLHLGYRRRSNGGTWIVRWFNESGRYLKHRLGIADDFGDADGVKILDYRQAQEAARQWYLNEIRKEHGEHIGQGKYTVADAMRDYLAYYAIEGKAVATTKVSVDAHILPELGKHELSKLTTKKITDWHHALANSEARLRTAKAAKEQNTREAGDDDTDAKRRRRATANRILTILKAALNHAWKEGRVASDTAWRKVKPFRNVDAPVIRYLTEAECLRLVNACAPDFRNMVKGALFTGCRYGELAALRVADYNPDAGTVAIRASKNGKPRHVVLTEEGKALFKAAVAGKLGKELIFTHQDGRPWGRSHQGRPLADACKAAKISPAISFHVLRHTHGSLLAMKGVPMPVIAQQLGHADTRMTEKHYAHLSPSYVADTIRQHFPILGLVADNKVLSIEPGRRRKAADKIGTAGDKLKYKETDRNKSAT